MAAIPLCEAPLAALKKSLRDEFPEVRSSHLSEALAYSLGFSTNAALKAAMAAPIPDCDRPFELLRTNRFVQRLVQFDYPADPEFDFELTAVHQVPGVVSTEPLSAYEIAYSTARKRAWRNLMVCAVNAALDQRLFTLRPGDNRFKGVDGFAASFDFVLPNGLPARGAVSDAGFDELAVHAAVNPKGPHIHVMAEFEVGDAVGMTWLERERGAWMQSSDTSFHCRKALVAILAELDVETRGYGDRGNVIM